MVGLTLGRTANFLTLAYIAHEHSLEVFGAFTLVYSATMIVVNLASAGLPRSFSYFLPRYESDPSARASLITLRMLGVLAVILVLTTATVVVWAALGSPGIRVSLDEGSGPDPFHRLIVMMIPVLVSEFCGLALGELLRGMRDLWGMQLVTSIIYPLTRLAATVALGVAGLDTASVLVGGVLVGWSAALVFGSTLLGPLATRIRMERRMGREGSFVGLTIGDFMRYSVPLAGVDLMGALRPRVQVFILGLLGSVAIVGQYQLEFSLAIACGLFATAMSPVTKPYFAHLTANARPEEVQWRWNHLASLTLILTAVPAGTLWIAPDAWVQLVFGKGVGDAEALPWLALAYLVSGAFGPLGPLVQATGRTLLLSIVLLVNVTVMTLLGLLLVPGLGLSGAALAFLGGGVADTGLRLWIIRGSLRIRIVSRVWLRTASAIGLALAIPALATSLISGPVASLTLSLLFPLLALLFLSLAGVIRELRRRGGAMGDPARAATDAVD